ncbi:DUF4153 domain-containing protein [Brevundimonas sp.]|uniref:DUF4153 domain-containing protein n=1 Tax=Brevundimonas sp. TaxID=1871086 RepID=UPI0026276C4E|nr:DUF4153 domain-containing protein [Brevundimonas sp.]
MTTTTDSAGRSDLGQNDRLVGLVRLVIGLAQGIALYLLVRASEGEGVTWSSRFPETFGPLVLVALFLPPPLLAGVGRLRWPTLAIWGAVAAAALAFLAWHDVARQAGGVGRQMTFPLFAFSAAALFIAHHLIVPADRERKLIASFPAYFDAAWMAGVQLVLSIAFAGAFWLLLFLGAALFNIIGLSFLGDLIEEGWFSLPLTGLAFATAVHLTDVRDGLIRGIRTVALMLLSWLLLVLTVLVGGFLAALPFTGLEGLWETGSATALVLSAAGGLIILINAAYQDGRPDNLPPAVLRVAVRVASILLTPLVLIAFWGLSLRIGQHGLTPDRIIAVACALVGAAYAIGYGMGAILPLIRKGSPWMKALEMTNVATAILVVAVILALFTPLADPARLSVGDQVARLNNGKVAPDKFDYAFLKNGSGKVGDRALGLLERSSNPDIARLASAARKESAFSAPSDAEITASLDIKMLDGSPSPFGDTVPPSEAMRNCTRAQGGCVARLIDLNNDGKDDVLVAHQFAMVVFERGDDGAWRDRGSYTAVCGGGDARDALRNQHLTPRPNPWPTLDISTLGTWGFSPNNLCETTAPRSSQTPAR